MPTSTDVEQLRIFLGFTNYLTKAQRQQTTDTVGTERCRVRRAIGLRRCFPGDQRNCFHRTITCLLRSDKSGGGAVRCDASTRGLGAALIQEVELVVHISRSMTKVAAGGAETSITCDAHSTTVQPESDVQTKRRTAGSRHVVTSSSATSSSPGYVKTTYIPVFYPI